MSASGTTEREPDEPVVGDNSRSELLHAKHPQIAEASEEIARDCGGA
jgi:hypothetical protein